MMPPKIDCPEGMYCASSASRVSRVSSASRNNAAIIKWSLTILFICLSFTLVAEANSREDGKLNEHRVNDLSYGVALYEFFQQNYFQAMTEILVAQQQQSLVNHQDDSEILLGGIQLSYGMDLQAQTTFESLLEKNQLSEDPPPSKKYLENRARAWFYLGKLAYQKNNTSLALNAFSHVDDHLTADLYDELAYLHEVSVFELAQENQENRENQENQEVNPLLTLSFSPSLSKSSIYRYYRDYNQAVNSVRLDNESWETSVNNLERLYKAINQSNNTDEFDELIELRDRVLTTLAYLYLREGKSEKAIYYFLKVRQGSTQEGSALVGYGWASINKGLDSSSSSNKKSKQVDYEAALTPWLKLQSRPMAESTTYEALLAVPFIYNASGLNAQALKAYDFALEKMANELDGLKQLTKDIENYQANSELSVMLGFDVSRQSNASLNGHWLDSDAVFFTPQIAEPNRLQQHLSELLAKKSMRSLFGQLNDIYWLESNLQTWRSRIDTFDFAIKERQLRGVELLSGVAQNEFTVRLNKVMARFDQLSTTLLESQRHDGSHLLLTEEEKASEARIKSALLSLAKIEKVLLTGEINTSNNQLPSVDSLKAIRLQLEKMQKVLYWTVSSDQVSRVWKKQKLRNAIALALEEANTRVAIFPTLVNKITEQTFYRQRLDNERERIEIQSNDLAALREKVEVSIVAHLNKELLDRESRLLRYMGKARLSKAALLERQLETSLIVNPLINSSTKPKNNNQPDLLREQG